ncbi:type II secretion system F family protein [Cytobacillus kochii]|uniref:competence type IV pilus assembly protein ComGB n=1 Tax=Cytobacillus kochii TaxID=859143 RepID=UPI001CD373E2|nr:competence type IV pilus assembly protein ComGB [Cytobacillus kochii]MCA1025504.1 type II secretion system F family protein [Cytobacillus kochii]
MKKVKWTLKEQCDFLKKVGELLSRGYSLSEAMASASLQLTLEKKLQLQEVIYQLKEGFHLHSALGSMNFNSHLVGYVFFAEQHGGLQQAFIDGSEMMQKRGEDMRKLKKALMYPCFLFLITILLFFLVEKIILPRFTSLFQSMNVNENTFMVLLQWIGSVAPLFLIVMFILLLFSSLYYYFIFRRLSMIRQVSLVVRIPIVGKLVSLFYTHYFAIQLHYLLAGGMSITTSLNLFAKDEKQPLMKEVGQYLRRKLENGEQLDELIQVFGFLELDLRTVIRHGQQNGKLEEELQFFSRYCLQLLEEKIDQLMKVIQPTIYLIVGCLIISLYLAVMLPMFQLMEGV